MLSRALGVKEYGIYVVAYAAITMLMIPSQFGIPTLVLRETASSNAVSDFSKMERLWSWGVGLVGLLSLVTIILLFGYVFIFASDVYVRWGVAGIALVCMIPIFSFSSLIGAMLKGLGYVVIGQIPELIIRPLLFIIALLTAIIFVNASDRTAELAIGMHAVAALSCLLFGVYFLLKTKPKKNIASQSVSPSERGWIISIFPLGLAAASQIMFDQVCILLLGYHRAPEEVAVYRVAVLMSALLVIGRQALSAVVMPRFASLYRTGNIRELQSLVSETTYLVLLTVIPVALIYIFFGELILSKVFGEEFLPGYFPLLILAFGQITNCCMGMASAVLNMTGHEQDAFKGVLMALCINTALGVLLIPSQGIIGASAATSAALISWNMYLRSLVKKRAGIETIVRFP